MSKRSKGRHRRPAGCVWRARWLFAWDTAMVTLAAGNEMNAAAAVAAQLAEVAQGGAL